MTSELTFNAGFEQFIRIKRNNNLSEHTITHYKGLVKRFTDFFNGEDYCSGITPDTIDDYITYIRESNPQISSVTINTYLRGLRTILYFFMQRDYMPEFKISLMRQEKKVKEVYTEAELQLLLKKPDTKKCDFAEYRNWVISNYLLATGNRLSTVCNVKIGDIDFKNHEILLKTVKNKRQHIIPLSTRLEKVLLDYLLYRKADLNDFLFCNRYGEQLKKFTLINAIKRYNLSRGVEKTSIHLYRHTFAKNWILNGGDIFRLKSILGHSSLDVVKEYAEMFGADLKRDFDTFNPLDNLDGIKNRGACIQMKK
jgi:integrase/recombinase XerD